MLISYYANKKSSPRLPSWQPSLIFFNIPIESGSIIKPCTLKHFQVTYRLHKAGYWTTVGNNQNNHNARARQPTWKPQNGANGEAATGRGLRHFGPQLPDMWTNRHREVYHTKGHHRNVGVPWKLCVCLCHHGYRMPPAAAPCHHRIDTTFGDAIRRNTDRNPCVLVFITYIMCTNGIEMALA